MKLDAYTHVFLWNYSIISVEIDSNAHKLTFQWNYILVSIEIEIEREREYWQV